MSGVDFLGAIATLGSDDSKKITTNDLNKLAKQIKNISNTSSSNFDKVLKQLNQICKGDLGTLKTQVHGAFETAKGILDKQDSRVYQKKASQLHTLASKSLDILDKAITNQKAATISSLKTSLDKVNHKINGHELRQTKLSEKITKKNILANSYAEQAHRLGDKILSSTTVSAALDMAKKEDRIFPATAKDMRHGIIGATVLSSIHEYTKDEFLMSKFGSETAIKQEGTRLYSSKIYEYSRAKPEGRQWKTALENYKRVNIELNTLKLEKHRNKNEIVELRNLKNDLESQLLALSH